MFHKGTTYITEFLFYVKNKKNKVGTAFFYDILLAMKDVLFYNCSLMNAEVSVIGAGNVVQPLRSCSPLKIMSDVILFDILEGMPQGKALDIACIC